MSHSPADIGPVYWSRLHQWAEEFKAAVGDSCGCGEFAVKAVSALHDLVNAKLGKPLYAPENFREFRKAMNAVHVNGHGEEHLSMAQALGLPDVTMERSPIPREQLGLDLFPTLPEPPSDIESQIRALEAELQRLRGLMAPGPSAVVEPKFKLFPFQEEGVAWLKDKSAALLADDMGLGKTVQAIHWAAAGRLPSLVVVPAAVAYNWENELRDKWRPDDTVTLLFTGEKEELPQKLTDWTITTYSQVQKFLPQLRGAGFKAIIIDEAQYIKTPDAQRTRAILELVAPEKPLEGHKPIPNRLAVTGTPIMNRPPELFPLLVFLGKEPRSGYRAFVDRYAERQEAAGHEYFVGYKNLEELHKSIQPFTLRRLKKDVLTQLPPKVQRPMWVGLTNAAEYREAERHFLDWYREHVGDAAADKIAYSMQMQILVQLGQLRQIAARGKVGPVSDFLEPCQESGHKVLVFSNFVEVVEELQAREGGLLYTGATPKDERDEMVQQFQTDPDTCFFFGTIGAAGVGITLTAADRAVFVDLPWTPAAKAQAEDRAHRIGQTKRVEVIPFLAKGTVDERVMALLADKEKVIAQAIDGLSADRAAQASITQGLINSYREVAYGRQQPLPIPAYLSDDDAETVQGWRQGLDPWGSRCRDPKTGEWVGTELCGPVPQDGLPALPSAPAKTMALSADGVRRYEFEHRLVEASALIPSHDPFTFQVNPAFSQKLQPRMRDRAAAELQVLRIAATLSPDALLTDFHTLDRGAPIVGPDLLVESGNGRVMGIIRSIQDYPENYTLYRGEIEKRAGAVGIDPTLARGMKAPVLVRVRKTTLNDQERVAFVQEANVPSGISRSAIEQARTDSEKITLAMLDALEVGENESILDALRATRNVPFLRKFLDSLPQNDQAQLLDAQGRVNQDGLRRTSQAIFVSAFGGGEPGLRLGAMAFESADQDVRTVFNGISRALGPLAKAESLVRSKARPVELSIGDDLAQTVRTYAKIKNDPSLTVAKYLDQSQMFERELTPFQEVMLRSLDEHRRSAKRLGAIFSAYAGLVDELPPPEQGGLFGPVDPPTKEMVWDQALRRVEEPQEAERAVMVQEGTPWPTEVKGRYAQRIRWGNVKKEAIERILNWRPLRNLLYQGIAYQVAVEVQEAGFGDDQYQVSIGYMAEGARRKGYLTTAQVKALRKTAQAMGDLSKEFVTRDPGVLVFQVTLPGPEAIDLVLKPQLPERERDEKLKPPLPSPQRELFQVLRQEPLTVLDTRPEAKCKAEGGQWADGLCKKPGRPAPVSPAYVEGDQVTVDTGEMLAVLDPILLDSEKMGIVDVDTLRVVRDAP